MSEQRPSGWIVRVKKPGSPGGQQYATVAETVDRALALVGDHLGVTIEQVEFLGILTESGVKNLSLNSGDVKRYG
jgi:hypothetical protein